jgi:hypothetical protein
MHPVRTPADRARLAALIKAAFGGRRHLADVTRLGEATKKGVYRVTFEDESTAIVYIWDAAENYWPSSDAEAADLADPFSPASGLDLFEAAQAHLDRLGIRTPRLYLADRSHAHYPADVAVVEDLPGPTMEEMLNDDSRQARSALEQLAEIVHVMHADKAPDFGKILYLARGGTSHGDSCARVVLDRALRDLAEASARDQRIAEHQSQLEETLRLHAASIAPRREYSLVHGELDPGHVLIDRPALPADPSARAGPGSAEPLPAGYAPFACRRTVAPTRWRLSQPGRLSGDR